MKISMRTKVLVILIIFCSLFILHAQVDNDINNCKIKFKYEVKPVSCYGGDDGAIDIMIDNTKNPLFEWSSGEYSEDIYNLTQGEYKLKITIDECVHEEKIIVGSPEDPLKALIIRKKDISCYGEEDGYILIDVKGGTSPYQFSIDNRTAFSTNGLFDLLGEGNYKITVKDNNSCVDEIYSEIEPVAPLSVNIGDELQLYSGEEMEIVAPEGFMEYFWSTGESTRMIIFKREVSVETVEIVNVDVLDENGCRAVSNDLKIIIIPQNLDNPDLGE